MIQLITPDRYGAFLGELAEMHRLRYRIFKERLGWDVQVSGDMEVDEFDACRLVYLLQRDDDGRVQGCVRLLPTTGPTMLRDTFPALMDGQAAPASDAIWESSRFGVDLCTREAKTAGSIARATYELFAGMIEFGLMQQLTDIVTVTDARMERILCRARWPLKRLGAPRPIGKTIAVAGYLEVSPERLRDVRQAGRLSATGISDVGARSGPFTPRDAMERAVA
jgi:acyl homoserine lactone synthase